MAPPAPRPIPGREALLLMMSNAGCTTDAARLTAALREQLRGGASEDEAMAAAARSCRLWAYIQYGNMDRLLERVEAGAPVLVQVQELPEQPLTRSYAVVEGRIPEEFKLRLRTAGGRVLVMREADFRVRWERVRSWMMTLCAPEAARWELRALERVSRMHFYDALGLYAEADAEAAQALLMDGRNADLCVTLGVRERLRGRNESAEKLLRRALRQDETLARAANNLAYLLAEQNRNPEEAERLARGAVLREPTNPRVLDTLGFVLQQQGRWEEALPVYERSCRYGRHMPPAARRELGFRLVVACLQLDRRADAARVVRELMKAEPGLMLPPEWAELAGE